MEAHVILMTLHEIKRGYVTVQDPCLYLKTFPCKVLKIPPTLYKLHSIFQIYGCLLLTKAKASVAVGLYCSDFHWQQKQGMNTDFRGKEGGRIL